MRVNPRARAQKFSLFFQRQPRLQCWWWTSTKQNRYSGCGLTCSVTTNMWSLLGGWGGGRGLHAVMTGRVVEWFWMAKCNHNCWNSIAVSFVKASCEDKTCPLGYSSSAAYSGAECLPFLCAVWAWSCCQLRTNSDKHRWRLNNCCLNTALVLDFQLCVLQLVRWVCCGDYHPWNVQLNICPGVLL